MSDFTFRVGIPIALVLLLITAVWVAVAEARQWEAFKTAHSCYMVEKIPGTTSYGTGYVNGKLGTVTTYTPSKTAWRCDDGIKYWR